MRYLRLFAGSAIASFLLVWAWVATMPMAFMDPEYPAWRAKQVMLDRCDLGQAIVLGDSRAAADIIPTRFADEVTNLAVGGGEAIEAFTTLQRALACSKPPRLVIISLDPGHFSRPDLFWERSVRFGLVQAADLDALREASRQTGDMSVYAGHRAAGLPLFLRDVLEEIRFPPFYFASLAHSGGILRWWRNQRTLNATLERRGQYAFGTAPGSDAVALDGHLAQFQPLPILDHYFNRMLALLDARGIEARFIAMPVNDATWREIRSGVRDDFAAYLARYERRYKHFHVTRNLTPHWPDHYFGDEFCHLNPEGAERFSTLLSASGWGVD